MGLIAIKPKKLFSAKGMEKAINRAFDQAEILVQADFDKTIRTWKHKPKFQTIRRKGERIIYTENEIYSYISGGTRVRYAIMSPDFKAKTKVRTIASYNGRGGMVFISRQHPRPGIKAREFPDAIIKRDGPKIRKFFTQAIADEVATYG